MKNRFEVLGDIEDPKEEHDKILVAYRDAAGQKSRASHGYETARSFKRSRLGLDQIERLRKAFYSVHRESLCTSWGATEFHTRW